MGQGVHTSKTKGRGTYCVCSKKSGDGNRLFEEHVFRFFRKKFAASEGVPFPKSVASEKWWRGLKSRHPNFSLRVAEATTAGRHMSMTRLHITSYFSALKSALTENNLFDQNDFIWNMDETGLTLSPKPPKIIAQKGSKIVHCKSSNSKELITIIACGNAAGRVIPPHAVIPGKPKSALMSYDTQNAPVGTNLSVSESGWTQQGIGKLWFVDSFLPNIGPERPQVLIMDGHDSHHHTELVDIARQENIILVELPGKTSHFSQPFDRSVFKAFKSCWTEAVLEFTTTTGVTVGHAQFFGMLKKAWEASMTAENVKAGFEACGICPYNPGAIPDTAYTPSELYCVAEDLSAQVASVHLPDTLSEMYTAVPHCIPALPNPEASSPERTNATCHTTVTQQSPISDSATVLNTAEDNLVVSLDISSTQPCIDLSLAIDEAGILQVIENVEAFETSVTESSTSTSTSYEIIDGSIKSSAYIALDLIESAITDEKKLLYHAAYLSGAVLDDSMYTTWSMYKTQALNKSPARKPQVVPSNPLLTLPKQEFSKNNNKKKPHYFVITSDEAFREKVRAQVEKEQRQNELEDRKKKRQLKKENALVLKKVKSEKR